MFSNEFLDSLPEDNIAAAKGMCTEFISLNSKIPERERRGHYEEYLIAIAAFEAFCKAWDVTTTASSRSGTV